jgi:hypothetical protein
MRTSCFVEAMNCMVLWREFAQIFLAVVRDW